MTHQASGNKSHLIRINANPEPIMIDTAKAAAIVIDMQNDFGVKGGLFDRAGLDISLSISTVSGQPNAQRSTWGDNQSGAFIPIELGRGDVGR